MKINERFILSGVILLIGFGVGYFARDAREWAGQRSLAREVYAPELGTLFNDDLPKDLEVKVAAFIEALNTRDYKAAARLAASRGESALALAVREREFKNNGWIMMAGENLAPWEYCKGARLRIYKDSGSKIERECYDIKINRSIGRIMHCNLSTGHEKVRYNTLEITITAVRMDGQWGFPNLKFSRGSDLSAVE